MAIFGLIKAFLIILISYFVMKSIRAMLKQYQKEKEILRDKDEDNFKKK